LDADGACDSAVSARMTCIEKFCEYSILTCTGIEFSLLTAVVLDRE